MNVLFVNRNSSNSTPGGDTIQMKATGKYLMRLGINVDTYIPGMKVNYADYQLMHFFNITRPAEILAHIRKTNIPFVVSTIYVDYSFYSQITSSTKHRIITKIFGSDGLEYLKSLGKHVSRREKIPYVPYLFIGQKRSIEMILKRSNCLLPNSESELNRLKSKYRSVAQSKVVYNGVDLEKFQSKKGVQRIKGQVLCVGRIEPMKNQLNLIRAINNTSFTLKIIGDHAPNHVKYYEECQRIAKSNVEFIQQISQEELIHYYQSSEIHILPSRFETTGLVSLEAAHLGCKIVVTPNGDTRDYFQDDASYCASENIESILHALRVASDNEPSEELQARITKEYNWKKTAEETAKVYTEVLNVTL